tara:strand:- start:45 stop:266 length:222 start_codon:yes stop_codon:yes gene_type:complete
MKKIRTGLSNIQTTRFGGLIAVMGNRKPYDFIWKDLIQRGLVQERENKVELTQAGMKEKDRLSTLAGLMFFED